MKPGEIGWAGHVTCMGEMIYSCRILPRKFEGKRPLGRPSLDGIIILKYIVSKYVMKMWAGFI
jgi:hypothetical protein